MQLYPNIPRRALCFRNFPLLAIVQQYFYHCLKATEHADSLASLICLLMTFLTGWLRKTSFVESFSDFKRLYRCDFCGQSRRRKFQKALNNLSANARHFSSGVNRKDSARWSNNALFSIASQAFGHNTSSLLHVSVRNLEKKIYSLIFGKIRYSHFRPKTAASPLETERRWVFIFSSH